MKRTQRPLPASCVALAAGLLVSCSDSAGPQPEPAQLAFVGSPPSVRAGMLIPAFSVSVQDSAGNAIPGNGSLSVTIGLSGGPAAAALSGSTTAVVANGAAVFSDLRVDMPGTGFRFEASVAALPPIQSSVFTAGARLRILDAPSTAELGELLTVHVAIQSDSGVTLPKASATIQLRVVGGEAAQPPGFQSGATTAGVATISGLKPARPGAGYRLEAITTALDADTSQPFSVTWVPVLVAGGGSHACALSATGIVACMGYNGLHVLGGGSDSLMEPLPILVRANVRFASISAGSYHGCGITANNEAYCWGQNHGAELGTVVANFYSDLAVAVSGGMSFRSIAAGHQYTCALTVDSLAYCWGANFAGRLGTGDTLIRTVPGAVAGAKRFAMLSTGGEHTCGVDGAGQAWCWGGNGSGQLGNGSRAPQASPAAVAGGHVFVSVSAGIYHTCALDATGKAWCWGLGEALGAGSVPSTDTAIAVLGGRTFIELDASSSPGTCARTAAFEVYCWGSLGAGYQITPQRRGTALTWNKIAVAEHHACGITTDGMWCFGDDEYGQLGNGYPLTDSFTPVRVIQ